jgi:hypothetical protein
VKRALALLVLVLGGFELGSFAAFRLATGRWFSWNDQRARRAEILGTPEAERFVAAGVAVPWDVRIHPYYGFGEPPAVRSAEAGRDRAETAPGTVIVGVTGGSVAWNFARQAGARLSEELRRSPAFAGRRIEIRELGHFAWKQPQQLTALAYYLALGGRLDVLVNLDGHNEVVDAATAWRAGLFPAYPYLWRPLTRNTLSREQARQIGAIAFWRDLRIDAARAFARLDPSLTAGVLWEAIDAVVARRIVEASAEGEAPAAAAVTDGPGVSRRFATRAEFLEFCARLWRDSSIRMKSLAEGAGAAYFHFLQPNQYVPGSKPLSDDERRRAYEPHRSGVRVGYPHLDALVPDLERAGVSFHSLVDAFADLHETIYVDACCHLNERGNEILAGRIAKVIRDSFEAKSARPGPAASAEERGQPLALDLGVVPAELDQVPRVAAVEVEVREQVGLASRVARGEAEEHARRPRAVRVPRLRVRHAFGRDLAEIARRTQEEVVDDPVGRAALADDHLVDALEKALAVGALPLAEDLVEETEPIGVVVDAVEEQRVQHLAEQERRVRDGRRRHRRRDLAGRAGVMDADHEHAVRAEPERGREWRVQAEAPVAEEARADADGREEERDRRRSHRVRRLEHGRAGDDERIARPEIDRSGAVLDEDHREPGADLGRGDRDHVDRSGGDVRPDLRPGDLVADQLLERLDVEEPGDRRRSGLAFRDLAEPVEAEGPERHAKKVPRPHAIDAVDLERAPDPRQPLAGILLGCAGREVTGVDRADARPAHDREARPAAEHAAEIAEQIRQHSGLVRAPGPAAGEHERDPRLAHAASLGGNRARVEGRARCADPMGRPG